MTKDWQQALKSIIYVHLQIKLFCNTTILSLLTPCHQQFLCLNGIIVRAPPSNAVDC